jgi:CarD family transcriptional regulator
MDYKIGDKVVYPNHGVGLVEQISYGVLNGRTERYFMIRIVSSGLRVMVPQSNSEAVGLRAVIRSNDATKVLGFLEKGKLNSHHDWKHRFKENSERMRTGSLLDGERDGHRAKYDVGIRGRPGSEVAGQGEAAVSIDD